MKKWTIALITASLAGTLLAGCGDEPRKEAKLEDICAAYKAQLDNLISDTSMTEQDKQNMLPRLSGYSACKDSVGTGGLVLTETPGASSPSASINREANQRSQSAGGN